VAIVQRSTTVRRHDDRRLESLGQTLQGCARASRDDATARIEDWAFCSREQANRLLYELRVELAGDVVVGGWQEAHFAAGLEYVGWYFQTHRTRMAGAQLVHRLTHQLRHISWFVCSR
jgi:hypothetical protein